jgi:hypothetical protein
LNPKNKGISIENGIDAFKEIKNENFFYRDKFCYYFSSPIVGQCLFRYLLSIDEFKEILDGSLWKYWNECQNFEKDKSNEVAARGWELQKLILISFRLLQKRKHNL